MIAADLLYRGGEVVVPYRGGVPCVESLTNLPVRTGAVTAGTYSAGTGVPDIAIGPARAVASVIPAHRTGLFGGYNSKEQ